MAKKKDKTPAVITPKSETKTNDVFVKVFGEQEAAHKSDYVTIAQLQEVLERAAEEYVEPVAEEESEDEEEDEDED